MIGGVTRQGGLPGMPYRVTLAAWVTFCHVNVKGEVTRLAGVWFVIHQICAKFTLLKVTIESNSTEGCSKSSNLNVEEH